MNGPAAPAAPWVSLLYVEWKRHGRHFEEYGSEFIGTAFMVCCVVGVVGLMFARGSPVVAVLPSMRLRLFLTGLVLGGAGWLVAISPPGKLSGAHINPAISIGFWVLGKMHFRDLLGYVAGQMSGGLAGAWLGHEVFPAVARQVNDAALSPGSNASLAGAFLAEALATFLLACVIFTFVSHRSLLHWTPAAATLIVGVLVCVDGNFSGCGINPARWLGPAVVSNLWRDFPAYSFGPIVGAALAALFRFLGWFGSPVPHTGKLFHDPRYRSVFKFDRAKSSPPDAKPGRPPETLPKALE